MNNDYAYKDASIVADFHARYVTEIAKDHPSHTEEYPAAIRITPAVARRFRTIIYGYFRKYQRDFPWRHTDNPYHILISEIMLQQTQTSRVAEKYLEFIAAFPSIEALAVATLREVLVVWQGMGYNRRARYLHQMARLIRERHNGAIPDTPEELVRLPGIGPATASSIAAFAFNRPVTFIETNIRAVFIHFFFPTEEKIADSDIIPLVEATLDIKNSRRWYSALMDYGAMLKKRRPNPSRKSARYQKQAPFESSRRQVRGLVLKTLINNSGISMNQLSALIDMPIETASAAVEVLSKEGLVMIKSKKLYIQ